MFLVYFFLSLKEVDINIGLAVPSCNSKCNVFPKVTFLLFPSHPKQSMLNASNSVNDNNNSGVGDDEGNNDNIRIEMVARLCNMRKVLVIPIVVDALGFVTKGWELQ